MLNETDINTLAKATRDGKVVYIGYVTDYLDIDNERGVAIEGFEDAPHVTLLYPGQPARTFYASECDVLSADETKRYGEGLHTIRGFDAVIKAVTEAK